jgi:hypothetical protein
MKKFKEFLENYDVYLDSPKGWVTPDQLAPAVPVNAPESVTKNSKGKSKKRSNKNYKGKVVDYKVDG